MCFEFLLELPRRETYNTFVFGELTKKDKHLISLSSVKAKRVRRCYYNVCQSFKD